MFKNRQTHQQQERQRPLPPEPTAQNKERAAGSTTPRSLQPASSTAPWERPGYGEANKIVTKVRYEEVMARLRKKLSREQADAETLPPEERRVSLQEHPLFTARLRWMEEHEQAFLLSLLRQGNQALLDHACDVVNRALFEYPKLMKRREMKQDLAMEILTGLVAPTVPDEAMPPLPEQEELNGRMEAFESWLVESQPQYPHAPASSRYRSR